MVDITTKWSTLATLDQSIMSGLDLFDSQIKAIAFQQNYMEGWRFRRCVAVIYDHNTNAVLGPLVQSAEVLMPRWTTSPNAVAVFVALQYYVPDETTPSAGDPKITLALLSGAPGFATTDDSGCEFTTENGALERGYASALEFDMQDDEFINYSDFAETMRGTRLTTTGFTKVGSKTTLSTEPRLLTVVSPDTDTALSIDCEDVLVYSVFAWEMYEASQF